MCSGSKSASSEEAEDDGETVDCKMLRVAADAGDRRAGTNAFANNEEQQMIIAAAVVRGIGITVGVTGSGFSRCQDSDLLESKRKLRGTTCFVDERWTKK